jgi:hypothetical protein
MKSIHFINGVMLKKEGLIFRSFLKRVYRMETSMQGKNLTEIQGSKGIPLRYIELLKNIDIMFDYIFNSDASVCLFNLQGNF